MKLLQSQVVLAEFHHRVWAVTPEAGSKLEDVLAPEAWQHLVRLLEVGARFEVIPADGAWFAELFVRGVAPAGPRFAVLRHVEFDTPARASPDKDSREAADMSAVWGGGDKWRVVRGSDKTVLAKNFTSRADAEAWIDAQAALV